MIVLVCGPSGSGKTTFITEAIKFNNCSVKDVSVFRLKEREFEECGKQQLSLSQFLKQKNNFHFSYSYNDSEYGFTITQEDLNSKKCILIDYPGEYPHCSEFNNIDWRGILILPPTREILIERLTTNNKKHRIESAIKEYEECILELNEGIYKNIKWYIYISYDKTALYKILDEIKENKLFNI